MTFLNGILLWGAAAVSIPFLVHLFNKNRYRTLQWGAMHLITNTTIVQKRRLRVENWFLMLLRMMIPLFLAICLAHPQVIDSNAWWHWLVVGILSVLLVVVIYSLITARAPAVAWLFCLVIFALPGWLTYQLVAYDGKGTFKWGDTEMSLVLVMDGSYSLEYQDASGKPFDKGREMAVKLVGDLRKGSDVQVIRMPGGNAYSRPRTILANVKEDLKEMEAGYGQADPAQAIRAISGLMGPGRMAHARREVVVVTDFQEVSWGSNEVSVLKKDLKGLLGGQNPPQITMIHVGQGERDNLAVMSLEYNPKLPLALKQELRVRPFIQNFSDKDRQDLPVTFRVDGKTILPRAKVSELGKGQKDAALLGKNEPFRHSFDVSGTHVIEVITDEDNLSADNSYLASIKVWDNIPVLIVDGEWSPASLQGQFDFKGESDFLRFALQPFSEVPEMRMTDLFNVSVVRAPDFNAEALVGKRVAIMANVARLTEGAGGQLEALGNFVRQGGGVLWFMGDQVEVDWYNQHLAPAGLVPMPLKGVKDREGEPEEYTGVDGSRPFEHEALEMFTGRVTITAEIRKWMALIEQPDDPPYGEMARLVTGDIFLVERKVGEGRVVLCTTTCAEDEDPDSGKEWMIGVLREYYVPLMQQLVLYLASSVEPERNLLVGQPVVAHFPIEEVGKEVKFAFYRPEEVDELTVKLQGADGEKRQLTIVENGARGSVRIQDTRRPGLYVLLGPDDEVKHYVVNTDRGESDLAQLEPPEIDRLAEDFGAQVVGSLDEYKGAEREQQNAMDVWKYFVWAVLIFCFGELILQQWMSREKI